MHGKNYYLTASCATCKFCYRTIPPDEGYKYFCRFGEAQFDPPKPPGETLDALITLANALDHRKALKAWEGKTEVEPHGTCEAFEYPEATR